MKNFILLFCFLTIAQAVFCQEDEVKFYTQNKSRVVDSLTQYLKTAGQDTNRVNALNLLSRNVAVISDFNKSMNYVKEAVSLAEKINFKKGLATAYNNIGIIYIEQANYPEALKNYSIALQMREEIGDKPGISGSYMNIGNVNLEQGNYAEALKNYLLCLKIGEELNDKRITADAYGSIANVYTAQGNNSEALKNDFISLRIRKENNDVHGILLCYLNIGNVYEQIGNYADALKNYNVALQMAENDGDKRILSGVYVSMGSINSLLGNYTEALKDHKIALDIEEQLKDNYDIAYSYIFIGKIYSKTNNLTEAREYLSMGMKKAKENGSKDEIRDAYKAQSELDSVAGNYREAYGYFKLYSQFKDSILNEKSDKQISQFKIQYETEKKDKQIKTQALQNSILQTRIDYSVAISLMIIGIITLLFYLFYLRNRKKKKEYEHMVTDLELAVLRSQLNPHFISNALSSIKTFIDRQPERASQFLAKFARLMRRILEQNEQAMITLEEELQTTELYMQIESLRVRYGFDYRVECDPAIDPELIMVPPLILQPTIENAIWHGLAVKKEKGHIIITIKLDNDLLKFLIEDDGAGGKNLTRKSEGVNKLNEKKSFGLSITRKRIEILSKDAKMKGYFNLAFFDGRTIAEIALPVNY